MCVYIQGGAEPTDTFRISILRRLDSLSWLAGRGTVEERTPFHMVRNSMAVVYEVFGTVISLVLATSLGLLGRPTSLYQTFSCGGSCKTVCSGGVS